MISGLRPRRSDSQPAINGIGTENRISAAVHRPVRALRRGPALAEVDEQEQVDDAEPSAAATKHRREVQPAQVAVAEDPPDRVADIAAGDGSRPVRAALADQREDRDRGDGREQPEHDRRAAPAEGGKQRHADQRDDDRADVATGDVRGDREPTAMGRELFGEEPVADRVLRRPADPGQHVGHGEGQEAGGECLGDEPAAEQQPAAAQQPARETTRVSCA